MAQKHVLNDFATKLTDSPTTSKLPLVPTLPETLPSSFALLDPSLMSALLQLHRPLHAKEDQSMVHHRTLLLTLLRTLLLTLLLTLLRAVQHSKANGVTVEAGPGPVVATFTQTTLDLFRQLELIADLHARLMDNVPTLHGPLRQTVG